MKIYLFISGNQDGLSIPIQSGLESVQPSAGVTGKDNYIRGTLAVGDVFVVIYQNESLASEQALDRIVAHYKAWSVNQPGAAR